MPSSRFLSRPCARWLHNLGVLAVGFASFGCGGSSRTDAAGGAGGSESPDAAVGGSAGVGGAERAGSCAVAGCAGLTGAGGTAGAGGTGPVGIVINEIESSDGQPDDWVELANTATTSTDVSGYTVTDDTAGHVAWLGSGTSIASGGYLVLERDALGFGLGSADAIRLYDASGNLIDSYDWQVHATTTYGRCPDGTGAFALTGSSTKGARNDCTSGPALPAADPWPGGDAVEIVDTQYQFGTNLSGLTYQPAGGSTPAVLWAIQNSPSNLFQLVYDGTRWNGIDSTWAFGKAVVYPNGAGSPDAEGVTKADWASTLVYVVAERDNAVPNVSRLSVLEVDTSASGLVLTAEQEWDLTADLPAVPANAGFEAITWIPDSFLVAKSFYDERAGTAYDPALYPDHGDGLFFLGLEATGDIHAYALDRTGGGFHRIASLASGHSAVASLEFDRDVGYLWAGSDDTGGNQSSVFSIDENSSSATRGRFVQIANFDRPTTLPNINDEGMAIAPESECAGGMKRIFWSDDNLTDGHALRQDTIPCGAFR